MVGPSNFVGIPAAPLAGGYSITRLSLFNVANYSFKKVWMKNFIKSIDVEAWKRILKGPKIPIVAGGTRKKIKEKYANADWKNTFANAKDLNILHCALNVTEYNNVLGYDYSIEV